MVLLLSDSAQIICSLIDVGLQEGRAQVGLRYRFIRAPLAIECNYLHGYATLWRALHEQLYAETGRKPADTKSGFNAKRYPLNISARGRSKRRALAQFGSERLVGGVHVAPAPAPRVIRVRYVFLITVSAKASAERWSHPPF